MLVSQKRWVGHWFDVRTAPHTNLNVRSIDYVSITDYFYLATHFVVGLPLMVYWLHCNENLSDFTEHHLGMKDSLLLLEDNTDESISNQTLPLDTLWIIFRRWNHRCHVEHDLVMIEDSKVRVTTVLIGPCVEVSTILFEIVQLNTFTDQFEEGFHFSRHRVVLKHLQLISLMSTLKNNRDFISILIVVRFVKVQNFFICLESSSHGSLFVARKIVSLEYDEQ